MKKTTLILILLTSLQICAQQFDYEWVSPKPHGLRNYSVKFLDQNNIKIFGDYFIKSSDGGNNWNLSKSVFLFKTSFVNDLVGWGRGTSIYKTTDGGENWIPQAPGGSSFNGVFGLDEQTAWVVGDNGLIRKTTNGGSIWTSQSTGYSDNLFDLQFVDQNNGFISSIDGYIYFTTDGGSTWDYNDAGHSLPVNRIFFIDQNNGWAGSNQGDLSRTTDGGNNWDYLDRPINSAITSLYFINNNLGFATCGQFIMRTTDGGTNWSLFNIGWSSTMLDVKFFNENIGIVCGSDGYIFKTTDGGLNWIEISEGDRRAPINLEFIDENNGFITGIAGKVLRTSDKGNTWSQVINNYNGIEFIDVNFINNNTGWLSGNWNVLLKTTDSGLNWNIIRDSSSTNNLFRAIKFFDENNGVLLGNEEFLDDAWSTSDGGNTIVRKNLVYTSLEDLNDMSFRSDNEGWIIGDYLFRSDADSLGRHWNRLTDTLEISTYSTNLYVKQSLSYTDSSHGFFSAQNKLYEFKYKKISNVPYQYQFYINPIFNIFSEFSDGISDIYYADDSTFYVLGSYGIYKTEDEGNTFTNLFETNSLPSTFSKIHMFNQNEGLLTGFRGTVKIFNTSNPTYIETEYIQNSAPDYFALSQNYPNPFNPSTTIKYSIPNVTLSLSSRAESRDEGSRVQLKVYDIIGNEVATLVNEEKAPGVYSVSFDAGKLSSGVYFYKIQAGSYVETKKMLLLK